jgi:hypothetical protein
MAFAFTAAFAAVSAAAAGRAAAPFALPTKAKVSETAAEGGGWTASGEIGVSLKQAQAQFASKAAAAGWTHLHTIPVGRDRTLEAWTRGGKELTLMLWRIGPGKSGFSYGLSSKAGRRNE